MITTSARTATGLFVMARRIITTHRSRRFVWNKQQQQQQQQYRLMATTKEQHHSRTHSTITATASPGRIVGEDMAAAMVDAPNRQELWRVFCSAAVPMVGFGFMDQTVMLQAGNVIDCTIGVTFGLSTLTAAAFGQVCSDASGVLFGGTLDSLYTSAGMAKANLTAAQRTLPLVKRVRFAGSFFGVILGCCLGLLNLFFIDTDRSATLKLQAFNDEQEFEFQIEASNATRKDATTLKVRGPDVDGLLASMTAALAVRGCSLVELHAQRRGFPDNNNNEMNDNNNEEKSIEDVFYVVNRESGKPFHDDELEELAKDLLDSTRTPMTVSSVKAAMNELENTNSYLRARIQKLEKVVQEKQITIVPTPHDSTEFQD